MIRQVFKDRDKERNCKYHINTSANDPIPTPSIAAICFCGNLENVVNAGHRNIYVQPKNNQACAIERIMLTATLKNL